ncbi:MAG: hypothetical protein ABJH05_11875 [Fulvivirga sp.]
MVNQTNSGYTIKAEGTLEYGIPDIGVFWTKKVTMRTYNFNPCTDTGILFIYKE